jgi:hypothetical protein
MQEEDVVGVMPSKDFAALLPLADRILIEVTSYQTDRQTGFTIGVVAVTIQSTDGHTGSF